ncbi:hypothetical protein OIU77_003365 [Salix suchowensis]|uniref:Uncharacterized protein n=1 Tax=Salix suchowensis TaxID=1278906 RepID=A0ABQ9B1G8_9ROSI|nr:hypothetical protein OIU77_003365 [Salix suchowensis]
MFFHDAIHRRLVSLLRPWLQDEPETELHLGLINSELTVKKFKLDVSALNNESESSRFKFREVTVDHLSLRFSNWSSPACKIGIRGVNITLLAGEVKEEGSLKRERKSSEEKKKAVAGFDPEGSALHDVLERILLNPPSRNWFKTSLSNLVLKHCHFQISDTNLQVQFPNLNDAVVCLLELKEFNGESEHSDPGCLLRGVVGAVFKPLKVVSFVMNFRGFGFAYKMEDQINHISSFTDLRTCIKLNDLRVADVNIRAPKLSLLFSPFDLLVLSAFGKLSTKEPKHVRSGRQLWKLAANRLGYMPSSPRLSLQKLVDFICLWLRYQNAYEYLLSLLGYSADNNLLKMSVIKLSEDKMFLNSVKHNWEEISGIEKELSVEAIAQARRIARYRAVSNIQNGKNSFKESSVDKQSLSLSCGKLKVKSSSVMEATIVDRSTLLEEMWLAWQRSSMEYKDNEIACSETPWLLCEIKNCLMDPNQKIPISGFWKCSLTTGKIDLALGYSSVLSLAILLGQIQHALNLNENTGKTSELLDFSPAIENQEGVSWEDRYEFGDKDTNQDDYHLGFDIQNIEVVVWPTSKSDLALTGWSESDGAEPESHKLREPRIIEIPKPDNEKYASEGWISLGSYFNISGFDIYSGSPAERERNQIFSLKPIAARLSLFREFVHMFSTTVIAFSAAFSVTASGLSIISYMDELYVLFQVVASLLSTVSLDMSGFMPLQNFLRENMVFNEPENDEISAEEATLICNSTLVLTTGTFKFNSMDVILQNSRIDDKEGNSVKTYAAMSNQMAGHDFPDCGILISVRQTYTEVSFEEKKLEILCDLQGIQFVISRYQDHMLKRFDHSEADNAHLISECETSTAQSSRFARKLGFATDITSSSSSHWILINVTLGIIFVAKGSLKKSLDGSIQFNKLTALLEVGRNLHTISWGIKGGGLCP